jgi:hypothetical protein
MMLDYILSVVMIEMLLICSLLGFIFCGFILLVLLFYLFLGLVIVEVIDVKWVRCGSFVVGFVDVCDFLNYVWWDGDDKGDWCWGWIEMERVGVVR